MKTDGYDAVAAISEFACGHWTPDAPTRSAARMFMLDSIGVGLSGARVPWSRELLGLAQQWGGAPQSGVWGSGAQLSAPMAAMINAYQIHNQEYDCVHEEAVVHPMAVVLASLMAFAETRPDMDGERLLTALCVGVEVAVLLGVASAGAMRFFRPGICGALGATAGMARLACMDRDTTVNALGLSYSQLCGTMQAHLEGSQALPMQIAFAARNAVMAVQMAEAGLGGPKDILQGQFGFYQLFETPGDLAAVFARLGSGEMQRVSHKPFPSGRATHGVLDGLLRLGAGTPKLDLDTIAAVRVYAPPLIIRLVGRGAKNNMEPGYARLCAGYVVARLLQQGSVRVEDFDPPRIAQQSELPLTERVSVLPSGLDDPNAMTPQRIEIELHGGEVLQAEVDHVLGSPQNPLSQSQHERKFYGCTESVGIDRARAEGIAGCVEKLDSPQSFQQLVHLLLQQNTNNIISEAV